MEFEYMIRRLGFGRLANEYGTVAAIWAFALLPIIAVVGLALDTQMATSRKERVQQAIDSAALAGGRMYQTTHSETEAREHAATYFSSLVSSNAGLTCDPLVVSFPTDNEVKTDVRCYQETIMSGIVGRSNLPFDVSATSIFGADKLDVAFVFDISGSMNSFGRLVDLKLAATSAVNMIMPVAGSSSVGDVRVAMVGYNHMVDAGSYFENVTGMDRNRTYSANYTDTVQECKWVCGLSIGSLCLVYVYQCNWVQKLFTSTKSVSSTCVYERDGTHAFDDFQPTQRTSSQLVKTLPSGQKRATTDASNADGFFSTAYAEFNYTNRTWTTYGTDCRSVKPMELTSSTLDATLYIQTLNADGGTAGHQGLSWGWQLISPTWSGVFDGTATPEPYDDPEVKKAIILMTDGEFIHQLYSGQGSSADQAKTLCDNIKAEGILIYTIAFQAPTAGEEIMSYCASGNEFAFTASTGVELIQSYEAIALTITDLRIKT